MCVYAASAPTPALPTPPAALLPRFWHYPQGSRLRLAQILVLPPHQGRGAGALALEAVQALADELDACDLSVSPSSPLCAPSREPAGCLKVPPVPSTLRLPQRDQPTPAGCLAGATPLPGAVRGPRRGPAVAAHLAGREAGDWAGLGAAGSWRQPGRAGCRQRQRRRRCQRQRQRRRQRRE